METNLLMINTGNGKGKTTAALGQVFRALGHGWKVCMIQFIKGSWKYGEMDFAKKFENLDFHVMGRGFTWKSDDIEKDIAVAKQAWEFAKQAILSKKYRLVVLDEFTYLIKFKMIDEKEAITFFEQRPDDVHIVITGRDASPLLINCADTVTDMTEVKHHFNKGYKAQKGIEF